MGLISNILFPVDFSRSCVAMGPYVKRAAALFSARVSLLHVFDPNSYTGAEVIVRGPVEIAEEHREIARQRLDAFLHGEFPPDVCPRLLESSEAGDVAQVIAATARRGFDFIMMPSYGSVFRRMLLGSTVAKVLDEAGCPVATSRHADTVAPHPVEHREWLCAIGLGADSERVLRFAHQLVTQADGHLRILHAIPSADPTLPVRLDLEEQILSEERREARERIDALQQKVGYRAEVLIAAGPVKDALLEAIRRSEADALIIGRSPQPAPQGRLRDLTYIMIRDSPVPVISV
jgi:nucleotide-binding universal stress UspA family protein